MFNHDVIKKTFVPLIAAGIVAAPAAALAADSDVTIGMLSAFTGAFASFGQLQKEGAVLALEQRNYKVAGKTIKIIYADDQLDNELAVTKAKQLVEQDKVDVITGLVSGDEGLSVGAYMKGKNIPVVPMYSASEDSTMREWYSFIVRPTWTGAQPMDVFGYWLAKVKGIKKIYMIGEDYSYPYNQAGGFKRGFLRGGGVEVKTIWHAVPTSDYSSIIASIPVDGKYDAVLYNGAGSDAVAFVKQYVEFGMQKRIPLFGQSNTFEKPDLDSMPKEIVGAYSAHLTADDLDTPNWNKFRDAFKKRWNHSPSAASEFAYGSMELILRAIEVRKGDVADKAALVAAMRSVDISDEPRGPVKLDAYNAAIENVYIREVALGADGAMYNKGLFTAKDVSQFGPYDPKVYMKQPADGRTSPPDLRADMPPEMLKVDRDYEFVPFGK